jgi:crotonobetainyl-CoA:carnitine CoA-transferase CaiB-like acyl-CoA transferase
MGNRSDRFAPHGAWRCLGDDAWISLAIRNETDWASLCRLIPGLSGAPEIDAAIADWALTQDASAAADSLTRAGIPAAALASSSDLVADKHLRARGFWDEHPNGVLPGLPWRASFGRAIGPAPALGADTETVLRRIT